MMPKVDSLALSFPGSSGLIRTPEGIRSDGKATFTNLINYPIYVMVTHKALEKLVAENEHSNHTLNINAKLADGTEVKLFTLNSNFFGRVLSAHHRKQEVLKHIAPLVKHDPRHDVFKIGFSDVRSFGRAAGTSPDFTISSFNVRLLVGLGCSAYETHEFANHFFKHGGCQEALSLDIDVEESGEWKLGCGQIGQGPLTPTTAAAAPPLYEKEFSQSSWDSTSPTDDFIDALIEASQDREIRIERDRFGRIACKRAEKPTPEIAELPTPVQKMAQLSIEQEVEVKAEDANEDEDEDNPMLCPISGKLMEDPVYMPDIQDQHCYERRELVTWLQKNPTSPHTREPMSIDALLPNKPLREAIEFYKKMSKK